MDKYADLFSDHLKIARDLFIKEQGREPTLDELLERLALLNLYFFD